MTVQALRPLYVLESRLSEIRQDDGYYTDAGVKVYLGRDLTDQASVPALAILPGEEEGDVRVDAGLYQETVPYEIHGVCEADADKPFEAGHQLGADIRRAIYRARTIDYETLDDTAMRVEPGATVVTQREPGSRYCAVTVALLITHTEKLGDPDQPE